MRVSVFALFASAFALAGYVAGHFVSSREWSQRTYPFIVSSDRLSDANLALNWIESYDRGETDKLRRRIHAVAANGLYPPDDPEMPEIPWYTTTWHFLKHTFTGDSALYEVLEDRNAKYRATLEARFARVCEIRMPDSAQYEKQCGR